MPPSVVLEVMKILHREIELREETRAVEQARPAWDEETLAAQTSPLAQTQQELGERVAAVTQQIRELPDADKAFAGEIALLSRVEQVMGEAHLLLTRQATGPETIAAETEVIELLLQARRINPQGGGGGGANPGGGGTGTTDQAALALVGTGSERNAGVVPRNITQSTGSSGSDLPAEFRQGLDEFFNALERNSAAP